MNRMKKGMALGLALLMFLALAGCTLQDAPDAAATAAPTAAVSEYTEEERAQVVAKIGDYTVTKGDLIDEYNNTVQQLTYYGMQAPTADTDVESLQDAALEQLAAQKILLVQAEQMGLLPFDEETAAAVAKTFEEEVANMITTYTDYAADEGMEQTEANAVELINQDLETYGWNMDFEGYKEWLRAQIEQDKASELVEAKFKESVAVSEETAKAYYDELVTAQKEKFEAAPLDYLSAAEQYEMEGGDPVVVVPDGYFRVKVIGIQPEDTIDAAYDEKMDQMDTFEAEYGKLALADEAGNFARLKEIKEAYAVLKKETDTLYDAHTMSARAKAQEAIAKLEGGAAFDAVLAEYGDDDAYTLYETIGEKGRLMMPDGEDGWDPELHEALMMLADGSYSEVIEVDGVFYILQRMGVEEAGTRTFEQMKEIVEPLAAEEAAEAAWTAKQDEWLADTSLVTYFEELYRDIGKAAS